MSGASQNDFLTRYTEGWAQLLAAAGIGFTWRPDGKYDAGQVGGYVAAVPALPDKLWTLTPTPSDAHPTLTDSGVALQLRFRAGPDIREVWAMRDQTRRVMQGRFPTVLPTGIYVSTCVLSYGTSMGQDPQKRWEWADNYATRAAEPVTA